MNLNEIINYIYYEYIYIYKVLGLSKKKDKWIDTNEISLCYIYAIYMCE